MRAITVTEPGGPEQLRITDCDEPQPGPADLLVEVEAAGVNFIDTYQRTGLYPIDFPFTPGMEGAGTVVSIGHDVDMFGVGDRIAWSSAIGSYAERSLVPEATAVRVPEGVALDVAAAAMLQGMTAHYLALDTYRLEPGSRCLVHAGAGGVGLLLIQIAKLAGAEVFTTVGSSEKAELAREAGADHVILYRDVDFADALEEIAGPNALHVVYDGVGKSVFERSLGLLRPRGLMVNFGNASGPPDPISPLRLMQGGSLYLTRPSLFSYVAERHELERRSADLFGWIGSGQIDVRIGRRLPLADAGHAHKLLEGRQTTGKVLLETT